MAVYNLRGQEVSVKIVYYGPGLSGKTTNLEYIYSKLPRDNKGKMVSMKTRTDRTLFFDFLPLEVDKVNDLTVKFLIYTVPGQVYYNATRKLVLKGVDALVFVADSTPGRMDENRESVANLETNLNEIGKSLSDIPWVIQYNKRDIPGAMDIKTMEKELNTHGKESFEAVATEGVGVYDTFEAIARNVFKRIEQDIRKPGSRETEDPGKSADIEPEVMMGKSNSETDESESLNSAEENGEEPESVSEFVDKILAEDEGDEELDAEMEGYEDYGHLVELGDNKEAVEEKPAEAVVEEEKTTVATKFINDPLENLSAKRQEEPEEVEEIELPPEEPQEKTVTVPVTISRDDVASGSGIKILLDVTIE